MNTDTAHDEVDSALQMITPEGAISAARFIAHGDENFLTPAEAAQLKRAVLSVRRASGAARFLARNLMVRLGKRAVNIPKGADRAPVWPAGVVGALAHDSETAVAVVAASQDFGGLGIDVEPAEIIDIQLLARIADAREQEEFYDERFGAKMLFSIKEAVFKAVYPYNRRFLGFDEIRVHRASQTAHTIDGHVATWRATAAPRVLAVAWRSQ